MNRRLQKQIPYEKCFCQQQLFHPHLSHRLRQNDCIASGGV
jgi:hypothetical protein